MKFDDVVKSDLWYKRKNDPCWYKTVYSPAGLMDMDVFTVEVGDDKDHTGGKYDRTITDEDRAADDWITREPPVRLRLEADGNRGAKVEKVVDRVDLDSLEGFFTEAVRQMPAFKGRNVAVALIEIQKV